MSALILPYERLSKAVAAFMNSLTTAMPSGGGSPARQWASAYLESEAARLEALSVVIRNPELLSAGAGENNLLNKLNDTAVRLTQLARTLDGMATYHAGADVAALLTRQRQTVVFAAWQLTQALTQHGDLQPQSKAQAAK